MELSKKRAKKLFRLPFNHALFEVSPIKTALFPSSIGPSTKWSLPFLLSTMSTCNRSHFFNIRYVWIQISFSSWLQLNYNWFHNIFFVSPFRCAFLIPFQFTASTLVCVRYSNAGQQMISCFSHPSVYFGMTMIPSDVNPMHSLSNFISCWIFLAMRIKSYLKRW